MGIEERLMTLQVNKLCCCSLKTGTLTLGILLTIPSALVVIGMCIMLGDEEYAEYKFELGAYLSLVILDLITGVGLIFGSIKETPKYLVPWLSFKLIEIALIGIYAVISVFWNPLRTIGYLIGICVFGYCWVAVLSYYKELKQGNYVDPQRPFESVP